MAAADDISGTLQLGAEDFGIEAGGGALHRPMPTGIAARLGAVSGDFTAMGELLVAHRSNVTGLALTDSSGALPALFGLPALNALYEVSAGVGSLQTGRGNLDIIVQALNTAFAAAPPPAGGPRCAAAIASF
ncbi:MAG: hypothetical protein ACRDQZ_18350 [Mycobacteriales bacterium]